MIQGINDLATIAQTQPRIDFRLYKGDKKQKNRFGVDLKNQFRLESSDGYLRRIIANNYPVTQKGDSLLLESLNILPAFEKIEDTFDCSMELYNASGLIQKCDRDKIFLQMEEFTDPFGHRRKRSVNADKPCPVRGSLEECPHKCQKTGHLYFYVPELLEAGLNRLGCLSVHSFSDLIGIAQKLSHYQKNFGSIKTPPFASPETFNLIPYKLSRQEIKIKRPIIEDGKRTGRKSTGTTWAVQLEIEPTWLSQWQNYQRLSALQQLGFAPSPTLIEQVYRVEPRQIAPSSVSSSSFDDEVLISPEQALELKELLKNSQFSPNDFLRILRGFGHDRVGELTVAEFNQIVKMIKDEKTKRPLSS